MLNDGLTLTAVPPRVAPAVAPWLRPLRRGSGRCAVAPAVAPWLRPLRIPVCSPAPLAASCFFGGGSFPPEFFTLPPISLWKVWCN